MQDLDSISRIYNDLETVQEEEAGMTGTLEESKMPNDQSLKRSLKIIPKEEIEFE